MTKKQFFISKEELEELYYNKKLNYPDIEKIYNLKKGVIYHWAKKYNIKARHSFSISRTDEWKKKIAISNSKPLSEERKKKISLSHKGKKLTEETKQKLSQWLKGKRVGDKHPMWKGGCSSLKKRLRVCSEYLQWRRKIYERDEYICQECYKKSNRLNVHHIKPIYDIAMRNNLQTLEDYKKCDEMWDINNGITLCQKCHNKFKNKELEYINYFMEKINGKSKL